jgi:hypothetical protein
MTRILSLEQIMESDDITEKPVEIPQWGGSVIVRSLSHRVMREIKRSIADRQSVESEEDIDEDELEKWIFIKGMVEPVISEDQYEQLLDKSTGAIQKILSEILGSSKSGEKAITEAEKSLSDESERDVSVLVSGEPVDDSGDTVDRESASA